MSAKMEFVDLSFEEDKKSGKVRVDFLENYYFYLEKGDLERIAPFHIDRHSIAFEAEERRVQAKFQALLEKGFADLRNRVRDKPTIYIHRNSGIPLIGSNEFGLVDRGTNIIEVKPMTGCNLSCIFCSVSEGVNDKRDIVVEEEYLVEEFAKLASIKKNPVEANIGPQGEPLLYPRLVKLITDIKRIPNVDVVSINTNGLTLNAAFIDALAKAGLDRINLSLHSLDPKLASELAGGPYNLSQVLKAIKLCEGKIDVLLAPVLIPGRNEEELDGIIELSKTIHNKRFPTIGIQNYLNYKGGRNITGQMPWKEFFGLLKKKQDDHGCKLLLDENTFNIQHDETLPKPFRKGQAIEVDIKSLGRGKGEVIAASEGRCITVLNCKKQSGRMMVRLLRDKHNIYTAVPK